MKKISKDLVVSFIIFYLYLVIIKSTDSVVSTLIVSISGAVIFSLFSLIIGSLVRGYCEMNRSDSKEQIHKKLQISLVCRDTLLAYCLIYGFMTRSFGLGLSIPQISAYLVAAMAPTIVIGIFIKEMRLPFLKQYSEHDIVVKSMGSHKSA